MDLRRLVALEPGELLVVEEELEDVRGLRGAGELRVEGLVRAVVLPEQEVGDAAPPPVGEDTLVDDVDAVAQRLLRVARRRRAQSFSCSSISRIVLPSARSDSR